MLDPRRVVAVVFSQANADGLEHTLLIDDISIEDSRQLAARTPLPAVQDVTATGYERHIDVAWQPLTSRVSRPRSTSVVGSTTCLKGSSLPPMRSKSNSAARRPRSTAS